MPCVVRYKGIYRVIADFVDEVRAGGQSRSQEGNPFPAIGSCSARESVWPVNLLSA